MPEPESTVFIVDDDRPVREGLAELMRTIHLNAEVFATAAEFLESYEHSRPGCLLLDVRLPGMSGLRLQDEMITRGITLPIIFITGHGDLPMAVEAMKKGAYDFLEKPVGDQTLLDRINAALAEDQRRRKTQVEVDAFQERLTLLTSREREVLDLLKAGKSTTAIAETLEISQKTAQVHRTRILEKLQIESVPALLTALHRVNLM
jgi:two-component system, LuxR family, response regulator FixJ